MIIDVRRSTQFDDHRYSTIIAFEDRRIATILAYRSSPDGINPSGTDQWPGTSPISLRPIDELCRSSAAHTRTTQLVDAANTHPPTSW